MNARDSLFLQFAGRGIPPADLGFTGEQPAHEGLCLTEREQDILVMTSLGLCNKIIARRMSISVRTVENYRASLREKLGTGTVQRLEAVLSVILCISSQRVAALLQVDSQMVESKRRSLRQILN